MQLYHNTKCNCCLNSNRSGLFGNLRNSFFSRPLEVDELEEELAETNIENTTVKNEATQDEAKGKMQMLCYHAPS